MTLIPFLLHRFRRSPFLKANPGPYCSRPGRNGVDDTYDVVCLATENHIVSTHYWEEEEDARRIADAITVALNRYAGWHGLEGESFHEDLAHLRWHYPGPYKIQRDICPMYGEFSEVRCPAADQTVVICPHDGWPREKHRVATVIAHALDLLLRDYPFAVPRLSNHLRQKPMNAASGKRGGSVIQSRHSCSSR